MIAKFGIDSTVILLNLFLLIWSTWKRKWKMSTSINLKSKYNHLHLRGSVVYGLMFARSRQWHFYPLNAFTTCTITKDICKSSTNVNKCDEPADQVSFFESSSFSLKKIVFYSFTSKPLMVKGSVGWMIRHWKTFP